MLTLDLKPGDEVIMPSFTFVSTANAVVLHGARPVFADILPGTLNIDPADVARKITPRTRAIVPVHYSGVSADLKELSDLCEGNGIQIVEDAAQGVDAYYHDKHLGSIGDIGCLSFHDTKNITCGEGGAFLTNSDEIARKAEIIREKGTNRSAFLRGEVDKYTWIDRGSSYIQSDILAAVLEAQWAKRAEIRSLRQSAWNTYNETLLTLEKQGFISRPFIPEYCRTNYHTYFFTVNNADDRDPLLDALKSAGISATFHYIPLHDSPFGIRLQPDPELLPNTETLSLQLIRLPLFPSITADYPDFAERAASVIESYFLGT